MSDKDPSQKEQKEKKTLRQHLKDASLYGFFVLAFLSARSSFADHYYVPSGSMRPTVDVGDRIFVNKLAFGLHIPFTSPYLVAFAGPHRGDVVVLDSPVEDVTLLKRVVALPGDRVEVAGGRLRINGIEIPVSTTDSELIEVLDDHAHPIRLTYGGGMDMPATEIPAGRYLVLGDNRGESRDGRSFGLVERDRIRGRAVAVYWHDGGFAWREL